MKGDAKKSSPGSLHALMEAAWRAGASATAVIAAGDIVSEDRFADMCRKPRCENYGRVLID